MKLITDFVVLFGFFLSIDYDVLRRWYLETFIYYRTRGSLLWFNKKIFDNLGKSSKPINWFWNVNLKPLGFLIVFLSIILDILSQLGE